VRRKWEWEGSRSMSIASPLFMGFGICKWRSQSSHFRGSRAMAGTERVGRRNGGGGGFEERWGRVVVVVVGKKEWRDGWC
jgi:hypothetical protein